MRVSIRFSVSVLCSSAQLCVRYCLYPSFSREKAVKSVTHIQGRRLAQKRIDLSLFARVCSRCAEYTCVLLVFFLADIYIYTFTRKAKRLHLHRRIFTLRSALLFGGGKRRTCATQNGREEEVKENERGER